MEINQMLRSAINRRKIVFTLASITLALPTVRQSQVSSFNETINLDPNDQAQKLSIERFRTHTEFLLEEAQTRLSDISEQHPLATPWISYINELRQQLMTLNDLITYHHNSTY